MVRIQVISDIHLEFYSKINYEKILPIKGDILFLCGDISTAGSEKDFERLKNFLGWCSSNFQETFYVAGNHEFYTADTMKKSNTMDVIIHRLKNGLKIFKNVHFLSNNTAKLNVNGKTYLIIGTTLWADLSKTNQKEVQNIMNDYINIFVKDDSMKSGARRLKTSDVITLNKQAEMFIKRALTAATRLKIPTIVMSHHKPVVSKSSQSPLQLAYEVNMTHLMKSPMILWCFGHTHKAFDHKINGVRVYSNAFGYPNQQTHTGYTKGAVILI